MSRKEEHHPAMDTVLRYIIEYKQAHQGASPTLREIQHECGLSSTSMVRHYLHKLEKDTAVEVHGVKDIRVNGAEWRMG